MYALLGPRNSPTNWLNLYPRLPDTFGQSINFNRGGNIYLPV